MNARLSVIALGLCLLLAACATSKTEPAQPGDEAVFDFPGDEMGKTDVFGRALLGVAAPYEADRSLPALEGRLQREMGLRRAVGWDVARRVLEPVPLWGLAEESDAEPIRVDGGMPTVPRWQTWYGVDDFKRVFRHLYGQLGPARRAERDAFTAAEVEAAFAWNAAAIDRSSRWPLARYLRHVDRLGVCEAGLVAAACARSLQSNFSGGAAGNARITYSPATVAHLLENYGPQLDCLDSLDGLGLDAEPTDPQQNFSLCLAAEFPAAAVLIKAHWIRADFGRPVSVYDTDAESLRAVIADGKSAHWADGERAAQPTPEEIYTIRLRNGDVYRLGGLHIMTKELRHWVWVTLWWSDTPAQDFGADRPTDFTAGLDPVWGHYKMAVAVDYLESDPDPGQWFAAHPTLQSALQVRRDPQTWASNPYIERGRGNARTNCIGCHQHAGSTVAFDVDGDGRLDRLVPESIIEDEVLFPANGRAQQRTVFPTDYVWSTQRVDNLRQLMLSEVAHFARVDGGPIEVRAAAIMALSGVDVAGADTFSNNCTACHGFDGLGGSVGPSLQGRVPGLGDADVVDTLLNGKGGMPSWAHLSDQELADLRAYLRETFDPIGR